MSNNQQLNQKQREAFQEVLRAKFQDARRALSEKTDEAHTVACQTVLERFQGTELADEIRSLEVKLDESVKKLESIGFEVRDGLTQIAWGAPDDVKEPYNKLVAEQIAPEREKVEAMDKAIHDSWSIATLAEAKKLVESFT